jgi:hypothetical protein
MPMVVVLSFTPTAEITDLLDGETRLVGGLIRLGGLSQLAMAGFKGSSRYKADGVAPDPS